jgi:hypothetical protein
MEEISAHPANLAHVRIARDGTLHETREFDQEINHGHPKSANTLNA